MNLKTNFSLDLEDKCELFYRLLTEEDYDFKTKNIKVEILKEDNKVLINLESMSILDLKIATSAVIKSLEIIDKTINV